LTQAGKGDCRILLPYAEREEGTSKEERIKGERPSVLKTALDRNTLLCFGCKKKGRKKDGKEEKEKGGEEREPNLCFLRRRRGILLVREKEGGACRERNRRETQPSSAMPALDVPARGEKKKQKKIAETLPLLPL